MNEKIKQLAEQADNFADDKIQMPGEYHPDWHDVRDEKFAELIVKECIDVANKNRTAMEMDRNTHLASDAIKEHFGVEE
jgi:predicted nucleic-acid-binding Zn-ribbon protein